MRKRLSCVSFRVGGTRDLFGGSWPRIGFSRRPFHFYVRFCGRIVGISEMLELAGDDADERAPELELELELRAAACLACRGTGRDPMSDTGNWLPCAVCHGTGSVLTSFERCAGCGAQVRQDAMICVECGTGTARMRAADESARMTALERAARRLRAAIVARALR